LSLQLAKKVKVGSYRHDVTAEVERDLREGVFWDCLDVYLGSCQQVGGVEGLLGHKDSLEAKASWECELISLRLE
jgi:hypothetical protein